MKKPSFIRKTNRAAAAWALVSAILCTAYTNGGESAADSGATEAAAEIPAPLPAVCSQTGLTITLGTRVDIPGRFGMARTGFAYSIERPKTARITSAGLLIPLSKGTAKLAVHPLDANVSTVTAPSCELSVQVTEAATQKPATAPKAETRKVKIGDKTFTVQTVFVPKGMPVDIGLAGEKVGVVEKLQTIASRRQAEVAVNGTFFEAYGGIPEPWGTVISDGEIAHKSIGTTIGFTADGAAKMDFVNIKIEGATDGSYKWPNNWYAYFMNRTPAENKDAAILFTRKRGTKIGFAYGTSIVVRKGIVDKIAKNENVDIPNDGFVLVLTGGEQKLAERFAVGKTAQYRVKYFNAKGLPIDWSDVVTAVGAGPRLLTNGKVTIDTKKEGFTQQKIISDPAGRTGIGIRGDGGLVIVTVGKATILELADILKSLGAVQAMNLDGGGSSGLFANGKMLTTPGRLISNSLVFGRSLRFMP